MTEPDQTPPTPNENSELLPNAPQQVESTTVRVLRILLVIVKVFYDVCARKPKTATSITCILLAILTSITHLLNSGDLIFSQAAQLDLHKVAVKQFSDHGIDFTAEGSLTFNYSRVTNWYSRNLATLLAASAKSISVETRETELVGYIGHSRITCGNVSLPQLDLDLHSAPFEINGIVQVDPFNGAWLVNSILENHITVEVSADCRIKKWKVPFGTHSIAVNQTVGFPQESINITLDDLSDNFDEWDVSTTIDLNNVSMPLPLSFSMFPLRWEVLVPYCNTSELIPVASAISSGFEMQSNLQFGVSASIPYLDDRLTEECSDFGVSTLNSLARSLTNGESAIVYVSGSDQMNVPHWMETFLKNVQVPVRVPRFGANQDTSIDHSNLHSVAVDFTKEGFLSVEASLSANASLPDKVPWFSVDRFKAQFDVLNNSNSLATVSIPNWSKCDTFARSEAVSLDVFQVRSVISLNDVDSASQTLTRVLNGFGQDLNADGMADFHFNTSICDSVFYDISSHVGYNVPSHSPLSSLLNNVTVLLNSASVVGTSPFTADFALDVSVLNPLETSIRIDTCMMDFDIGVNDTAIGHVGVPPLSVEKSDWLNTTLLLTLNPREKLPSNPTLAFHNLQDLLSRYLSGDPPSVLIQGNSNTFRDSVEYSQLVSGLSLNYTLPYFLTGIDSERQSGFILKSTMHIVSSEIEFTVYNPISNAVVHIDIKDAIAAHDGVILGHIEKNTKLAIPPGVYTTPRIPIVYSKTGVGGKILREALNGRIDVEALARFDCRIDAFQIGLHYKGSGLSADIRL